MSWVRLDDRGAFHHKVMRAGNAAYGVWCRCLQMCGLNDSCGFVPRELALAIAGPDTSTIDRLTEVRLWVPVRAGESFKVTARKDTGRRDLPDVEVVMTGDGFFIRDFLHFNRTESDSRSPAREASDTGEVQETRAQDVHDPTEGRAQDARAPVAHHDAQKVRARKVQPPTRPDPSRVPGPNPTPRRAREDALASSGGDSPNGEQASARTDAPAVALTVSDSERAVLARLAELGWRSKTRASRFGGLERWESMAVGIIRSQDLTLEALDALEAVAKRDTKGDPVELLGRWVNPDAALWKGVLDDERVRAVHAAAMQRGRAAAAIVDRDVHRNGDPRPLPKLDIPPVYGEDQKPKENQQ